MVVNNSAVPHDLKVNFLAEPRQLPLPAKPTHHPEAMVTLCNGGL